jgi:hypothetical protein
MDDKHISFFKTAGVQQNVKTLSCGQFAGSMLAVYARFSTTKTRLLAPVMQLLDYLLASALHMAVP